MFLLMLLLDASEFSLKYAGQSQAHKKSSSVEKR